jgi:hypothetical protein
MFFSALMMYAIIIATAATLFGAVQHNNPDRRRLLRNENKEE